MPRESSRPFFSGARCLHHPGAFRGIQRRQAILRLREGFAGRTETQSGQREPGEFFAAIRVGDKTLRSGLRGEFDGFGFEQL